MLFELLMLGRGGQGVVTAGRIFAEAALKSGLFSQSFPEFGPERSGAPVRSYVRISDEPVMLRAPIENFDVAVVFERKLLDHRLVEMIRSGGLIVVGSETPVEFARSDIKWFYVDARKIVEELNRPRSINLAMLGALCSVLHLVPLNNVEEIVRRRFGEGNAEVVRRAASRVVEVEAAA
ncbi:MAG: 2-oxoacid:acceptor oxidoreductase family protein [Nitrososphaerota archaeon]